MEGRSFPVRIPYTVQDLIHLDPFQLIDEMGPVEYKPGKAIGAPEHPHRGFETVTYLLSGEMEHRDSWGNYGKLKPGDV
ncbi:pirin family protein, partial [Leptospira borgpetersenii serovar Hardjo-bovis]|nr:pirin family protein [Leptospira borgpetersenii serovar Hardjo-bovis]